MPRQWHGQLSGDARPAESGDAAPRVPHRVRPPAGPLATTERTTRRADEPHTSTAAHRAPRPPLRALRRRLTGAAAAVAAVAGLSTLTGPAAHAADNPYERGPAPTESSIEAARGPYAVADTVVSSLVVTGFGGGTIYYPTTTSDGTFGAVVVAPGYTADQSSMAWLGPRLASQGFVVFTIDTNTRLDQPDSRGRQMLAALDYLTERSSVRTRIDSSRLGVMGHSMGGGGTLEAAKSRPSSRPPSRSPRGTSTRPGPRSAPPP